MHQMLQMYLLWSFYSEVTAANQDRLAKCWSPVRSKFNNDLICDVGDLGNKVWRSTFLKSHINERTCEIMWNMVDKWRGNASAAHLKSFTGLKDDRKGKDETTIWGEEESTQHKMKLKRYYRFDTFPFPGFNQPKSEWACQENILSKTMQFHCMSPNYSHNSFVVGCRQMGFPV